MQVCRRIFGGMLAFAKGGARCRYRQRAAGARYRARGPEGWHRPPRIALVIEAPDDLPAVACGQSNLEQVFLNLLTNAREASSEGGTVVSLYSAGSGWRRSPSPTQAWASRPKICRIFEPFFTTKPTGNGLGLSICRSILWEVRGTLNLEREPGETRVLVTVPWASAPALTPTIVE